MKVYVLLIVIISTDVYNVEKEVFLYKTEKEARDKLVEIIETSQLDISVQDEDVCIDHYIDDVGSFYADIYETEI